MAFAAEASIARGAAEAENSRWPLLAGFLIAGALIAMVGSSYIGSVQFSPSSLAVSQTQLHASPASLAQSKSGASSSSSFSSFSTLDAATIGTGITPGAEGAVSAQAAASAFDSISR
jgi:hypothetical protein